jgi:septal ring factor EnvC (AmiA/AmiB activator)
MAGRMLKLYRDQIMVALLIAFFCSVPTASVMIDRAVAQTSSNKKAIESVRVEAEKEKQRREEKDTAQDKRHEKTEKDLVGIKSDVSHIKETVDRIEKKME